MKGTPQTQESFISKGLFICLLYIFFILSGYFEEKQYNTQYFSSQHNTTFKMKHPSLSIFIVSIFSSIISYIGYSLTKHNIKHKGTSPFNKMDKPLIGMYSILSKYSAEYSIQYVDYIIKVIGKSCKSASILIVTILFNVPIIGAVLQKLLNIPKSAATQTKNKANYSFKDLIKVTLTTFSVLLFNFGGKKKETSSSSLTSQDSISITVYLGYILLIFSLLCDGLLSLKEHIIFNNIKSDPMLEGHDKVISMELFMINSFISLIFCIGSVIYGLLFGDLKTNLMLYLSSGSLIRDVFMYGIFTSLGQVVIFIFLEKFGPLTLSMITSIRKVITIAVSIILFGKTILPHQFVSLIFAGVVIVWEMIDKKDKGKKDKKV